MNYKQEVNTHVWANEIAKAIVWGIGIVIFCLLLALLAPDSKADSIPPSHPPSQIASYLDSYTPLPLAQGVDMALAQDLLNAQRTTWGTAPQSWQVGSLFASENAVLRAIGVYVGSAPVVTFDTQYFWLVWAQSNIAINVNASGGFDRTSAYFGEVPVSTPEPETWVLLLVGLLALHAIASGYKRFTHERMVYIICARLRSYRTQRLQDVQP